MERRQFLCSAAATLAWGCGGVGGTGSLFSLDTVASTSRSMRLESGYFFGHDVRAFESIVYVLDLSGSMSDRSGTVVEQMGHEAGASMVRGVVGNGAGGSVSNAVLNMDKKVELVKDHLSASLRGLPSGAEFNVVLFADGVQRISPTMIPASAITTHVISAFISRLREGGGTSLLGAVEAGLREPATEMMVLTDGLPTDSSPQQILSAVAERNRDATRRVFTVGVGADQARDFLTQLATDNGGKYLAYS